jgi:Methyltransferase domain
MKRGKLFRMLQSRFRARRFKVLETMIRDILTRQEEVTILDAGGRSDYWMMLPPDLRERTRITVLNFASELELYPEDQGNLRIEEVVGDACNMPQYANGSYDLVHSNSVIEHVGSYQNMKRFADETRRVGKSYYMQTPNFWFPIDPHYGVPFFHWLPDSARIALFETVNVGYARKTDFASALVNVDHTRIISRRMVRKLFPDARITSEKVLFAAKSTMATRVAG